MVARPTDDDPARRALRAYLAAHPELVPDPRRALCPVRLHRPATSGTITGADGQRYRVTIEPLD